MVCDTCKLLGGERVISVLKEINLYGESEELQETITYFKTPNGFIIARYNKVGK